MKLHVDEMQGDTCPSRTAIPLCNYPSKERSHIIVELTRMFPRTFYHQDRIFPLQHWVLPSAASYPSTISLLSPVGVVRMSAASTSQEGSTEDVTDGASARSSGTTARGRRLLKVREEKRKREYDRIHNYPSWAK